MNTTKEPPDTVAAHLRVVQSIAPETVTGSLAKALGCGEGSSWLRISTLRMVGDESALPIGWTDVYIDPSYAEIEIFCVHAPAQMNGSCPTSFLVSGLSSRA